MRAFVIVVLFFLGAIGRASAEPLDPLTPEERRAAERIAAEDPKVRELLGSGKARLAYVEFTAPKPEIREGRLAEKEPPLGRHAEAVFYGFEGDFGVRVLVDLQRGRVLQALRIDGASVPLTREDLSEALALALESPAVQSLLGPAARAFRFVPADAREERQENVVRALLVHATIESDPCWRRRCAQLFFQVRPGTYMTDSVIVDLTGRRVMIQKGLK